MCYKWLDEKEFALLSLFVPASPERHLVVSKHYFSTFQSTIVLENQ